MNEDVKEQIEIVLELLKKCLINNSVSIALQDNKIHFFDTEKYITDKKIDGISVDINDLVK